MILESKSLETKRLFIRHGKKEDYVKVYEYDYRKLKEVNGAFKLVKLDPKIGESFAPNSKYINDMYDWIIYLKDNNIPIGNILADRIKKTNDITSIEIAYNLHPLYWGNEYIKESVIEVMNYLYSQGFDIIIIGYEKGNKKSKRVIEKLGFKNYKIIPSQTENQIDTYEYYLTKEEFETKYKHKTL